MDITKEKTKRELYNLLFHYNYHMDIWSCFNNEDKVNYFNGTKSINPIGRGSSVKKAYSDYTNYLKQKEDK
jgi:hypothetical protein